MTKNSENKSKQRNQSQTQPYFVGSVFMLVKWHQVFLSRSDSSFHSAARTGFKFCSSSSFPAEQTSPILCCLSLLLMVVPIISLSQAFLCPNCFSAVKRASVFWKSPPCPAWKCSLHSRVTSGLLILRWCLHLPRRLHVQNQNWAHQTY